MNAERRPLSPALLVGVALAVGALSCGEVPTLPDGIAYITSIILPSPAVAIGDTLRDSTGRATPLRVYSIGNSGDTITGVPPKFLVTSVPGRGVTLTTKDYVIGDSLRTVQIVAQVGSRLQTPPAPLEVVRQPDSLAVTEGRVSAFNAAVAPDLFRLSNPLAVQVSSGAGGARSGVRAIIVRYAVTAVYPASATVPDTLLVLVDDGNRFSAPAGRTAVDTTDGSGNASRKARAIPFLFDSIQVSATANNLKGVPLKGSPIRFIVTMPK